MSGGRPTPVALVEDNPELREATVQGLVLEGFDVAAFADGQAALEELTPGFEGVVVVIQHEHMTRGGVS